MKEELLELRLEELHGFRNHPFQVKNDEAMDSLCESIAQYGVLSPLLARPTGEGYRDHLRPPASRSGPQIGPGQAPGAGAGDD